MNSARIGECCGARVIMDFSSDYFPEDLEDDKKFILKKLRAEKSTSKTGTYFEAYLLGWQKTVWNKWLIEQGFKLEKSFINEKSGNRVYVYIHYPGNSLKYYN